MNTTGIRYILLTGNIGDGLEAVGPFDSQEEATEWAETEGVEYILMDIYTPPKEDVHHVRWRDGAEEGEE